METVEDLIRDFSAKLGSIAGEFGVRADQIISSSRAAPDSASSDGPPDLVARARGIIASRKARRKHFPSDLFHEPAWEMLMALFIIYEGEHTMNVKQLVSCSDAPATTSQRWIDHLHKSDTELRGVPTGYKDLDHMLAGLQPSDLIILAARPSMGKTSFSMNIAEHVAIEQGLPVAVFSMEMGAVQLAMRMLGSVGMLDQHRMRTGKLIADDWPRVTHAVQKMQDAQLYIDETPALSSVEVRARSRRLARQCGQLGTRGDADPETVPQCARRRSRRQRYCPCRTRRHLGRHRACRAVPVLGRRALGQRRQCAG